MYSLSYRIIHKNKLLSGLARIGKDYCLAFGRDIRACFFSEKFTVSPVYRSIFGCPALTVTPVHFGIGDVPVIKYGRFWNHSLKPIYQYAGRKIPERIDLKPRTVVADFLLHFIVPLPRAKYYL